MYIIKENEKINIIPEICDEEYLPALKNRTIAYNKSPMLKKYIESIKTKGAETKIIPTNISELDKVLGGGLRPGVYIFGANPGLGKTSLMLHILNDLASNKNIAILFNLEMSPQQITTKLLSNYSYRLSLINSNIKEMTINELNSTKYIEKEENKNNLNNIIKSYNENIEKYLYIINKSEDSSMFKNKSSNYVERIKVALENCAKLNVTPIIVIDFLQLLELTPEDELQIVDRRIEMNNIIEKLKQYSNFYKAPILLISSLSRNSYTKELTDINDMTYDLSVFKESGQIEYQADFLAILSKGKKIIDFGGGNKETINISILKTRYSSHTNEVFNLMFLPEYSYFEEITERND